MFLINGKKSFQAYFRTTSGIAPTRNVLIYTTKITKSEDETTKNCIISEDKNKKNCMKSEDKTTKNRMKSEDQPISPHNIPPKKLNAPPFPTSNQENTFLFITKK